MKIGIITFFKNSFNYGGVLQSYALVEVLKKNNYDTKQLQLEIYPMKKSKLLTLLRLLRKNGIKATWEYVDFQYLRRFYTQCQKIDFSLTIKKFRSFRNDIPASDNIELMENEKLDMDFDYYITGSDQVWNPKWMTDQEVLAFVKDDATRISYAASIGRFDFTNYEKNFLGNAIKKFKAVSVREEKAVEFLKENYGVSAQVVLDPTLLLTKG